MSEEEGAVQRYLNSRRISAIKDFTIGGGHYPAAIVLNWVVTDHPLTRKGTNVVVPDRARAAQLIDGQHRVAGLKSAIEEQPEVSNLEIPVAIYTGLDTRECANIFLSINTEQKPVPRSLVFDLYGVADEQFVDPPAVRARDLVMALHEEQVSPYYALIKLPGSTRRQGGIALSTAVTAIKPMVEDKGDFDRIGITELQSQQQVLMNYFGALKEKYEDDWDTRNNAFMYAAGFVGAIDFLRLRLIPYCVVEKSFTQSMFSDVFSLGSENLIFQEEVKGVGGREAARTIYDRLNRAFNPKSDDVVGFRL